MGERPSATPVGLGNNTSQIDWSVLDPDGDDEIPESGGELGEHSGVEPECPENAAAALDSGRTSSDTGYRSDLELETTSDDMFPPKSLSREPSIDLNFIAVRSSTGSPAAPAIGFKASSDSDLVTPSSIVTKLEAHSTASVKHAKPKSTQTKSLTTKLAESHPTAARATPTAQPTKKKLEDRFIDIAVEEEKTQQQVFALQLEDKKVEATRLKVESEERLAKQKYKEEKLRLRHEEKMFKLRLQAHLAANAPGGRVSAPPSAGFLSVPSQPSGLGTSYQSQLDDGASGQFGSMPFGFNTRGLGEGGAGPMDQNLDMGMMGDRLGGHLG